MTERKKTDGPVRSIAIEIEKEKAVKNVKKEGIMGKSVLKILGFLAAAVVFFIIIGFVIGIVAYVIIFIIIVVIIGGLVGKFNKIKK